MNRAGVLRPQAIVATLVVAFVAAKLPTLNLPYHWDEMSAFVGPAVWLSEEGLHLALPGLAPPDWFFGHPPGQYLALAALYRAFGHSILLTHAVAVALATLGLLLTQRLARTVFDPATGVLALVLFVSNPLFFAQAGLMHGDMSVLVLGLLTVSCHLSGNRWGYLASACALLLVKETGAAFVAGIAIHQIVLEIRGESGDRRDSLRRLAFLASPLIVFVAFFTLQYAATGQWVTNRFFHDRELIDISWSKVLRVTHWMLLAQGRFALSLAIVLALALERQRFRRNELLLMLLVSLPFWGAFCLIYFLPRYGLPIFPFLAIAAARALMLLRDRLRPAPWVAVAVCAVFFVSNLAGQSVGRGSLEQNMEYVDLVHVHREAASYLEEHADQARIYAEWPLQACLRFPFAGYVDTPLDVGTRGDRFDLIVWSGNHGRPLERVKESDFVEIQRFERRNKRVVIYGPAP